MITKSRN